MIDITPILLFIITLIGGFVTVKVVPLIMSKTTNEQRSMIFNWVQIACKAADQMAKAGTIDKKDRKGHVFDFLNSKGITYNRDEVNEMIESVVLTLPPLAGDSKERS